MLEIKRYANGKLIGEEKVKEIVFMNSKIDKIIQSVNERIKTNNELKNKNYKETEQCQNKN